MPAAITATLLYDLIQCPHRVTMELTADPGDRDPTNPFLELLWDKGTLYEKEVVAALREPFVDLSHYAGAEKSRRTLQAMQRGEGLIYGGRLETEDLLGDPDLLRREKVGYLPGDIKSGAGEEGPEEDRKPKKHYGVQLALYADILERLGLSAGRKGFIWDVHGEEVPYDLTAPKGVKTPKSLWDDYQAALFSARAILARRGGTLAAYAAPCKLCHWYTLCLRTLREAGDLTLIPELGRAARDALLSRVPSIQALAASNPAQFIAGNKTVFPGLGPDRLRKFQVRARLLHEGGTAYLRQPVELPRISRELFFDIEYDPLRDVCYLHGFIERRGGKNDTERFVGIFAEEATAEAEEKAFSDSVRYLEASQPCAVYYYSKYERTMYRKLRRKYPRVIGEQELEDLFDPARAVDLYYDVVLKATEWPTSDFSIKTLAGHLGFAWRDNHPSGAASIEWFHRWIETRDPAIRTRILEYNEDDCRATRVLRDAVERLPLLSNSGAPGQEEMRPEPERT